MAEETRSEQLAQKVTPTTRKKLDEILKKMGHPADADGHVKWDQEKLLDMIGIVETTLVLEGKEKYADVVAAVNQYTSLINSKIVSIISDLDTTEARIRSEYEKKLASKDSIIKDLQEKRQEQESEKSAALADASRSKDEKTIAEKNLIDANEKLKVVEESVKDKESIIQMLTGKLKESESKLIGYDGLKASEASLKEQVSALLHKVELTDNERKHEEELKNKALGEASANYEQLSLLRDENNRLEAELQSAKRDLSEQKQIAEHEQILAVERAKTRTENDMREQISSLRDEKTRLSVKNEGLVEQLGSLQERFEDLQERFESLQKQFDDVNNQLEMAKANKK